MRYNYFKEKKIEGIYKSVLKNSRTKRYFLKIQEPNTSILKNLMIKRLHFEDPWTKHIYSSKTLWQRKVTFPIIYKNGIVFLKKIETSTRVSIMPHTFFFHHGTWGFFDFLIDDIYFNQLNDVLTK